MLVKGVFIMIHACMPPLSSDIIARAEALSCSLLLDGAKLFGISLPGGGCLPHAIRPVNAQHKMVGTALTVSTQPGDNRPIHLAIYGAKQPGYVLVIDGHAHESCAYMGDLMLGACKALGFSGVVIDGFIRDRDGVTSLDFPVYTRGFLPPAPTKTKDGDINAPVELGGVTIRPGDLVMGDCDGVCVIPREHIEAVLDAAEIRKAYEESRQAVIDAYVSVKEMGIELPDLTPAWAKDILNQNGAL